MCTRVTYLGHDKKNKELVLTARSLDWPQSMSTSLWVYPRGLHRHGAAGPRSIEWTSKHGSVTAAGYGACTLDGINERGLVANVLYLVESSYGTVPSGSEQKLVCVSAWGQYVLDTFATVAEAVEELRKERVRPALVDTPDGHPGTVHLAMSDPTGDSAIIEYVDGKQVIHHGRDYQVMTNSPIYNEQLALNAYWKDIGGTVMMPGTNRAADRFVRASFYIKAIPQVAEAPQSLASVFGVIRNASVPFGITTEGQPNISSTLWRTVSDQTRRIYFFESTQSPFLIWLDLAELDFTEGAPSRTLELSDNAAMVEDGAFVSGNAGAWLKPADPFEFLPVDGAAKTSRRA